MPKTNKTKKKIGLIGKKKSPTIIIKSEIINREHWLMKCAEDHIKMLEEVTGGTMPKFNISCGWPSRGALSIKKPVIGQCWDGYISKGVAQLFISPRIAEPMQVGSTVLHELIHNILGTKCGHRGKFPATATAVGLIGKPTQTTAGPEYKKFAEPILKKLGPYPHDIMEPSANAKVQTTRLIKVGCQCGFSVRATKAWLVKIDAWGCPICNGQMNIPKFD